MIRMCNYKKKVILFIALLISMYSLDKVFSENNYNKLHTDKKVGEKETLLSPPEWKKLSEIWKDLNHIDNGGEHKKIKGLYDKLVSEKDDIEPRINRLYEKKLILDKEREFLLKQFLMRYSSLPHRANMVTCYDVSFSVMNKYKAQEDLEAQYDILEKLAKEKKISTTTYNNVKKSIQKNLSELTKLQSNSTNERPDDSLIHLLYKLSEKE